MLLQRPSARSLFSVCAEIRLHLFHATKGHYVNHANAVIGAGGYFITRF
jgi:hypothetical protein